MLERFRKPWPDRRAELTLGAVSLLIGVGVLAMIVFVAVRAWPIFQHNGLGWLGPGGSLEVQIGNMTAAGADAPAAVFHLRAWPFIYGTLLTSTIAVVLGLIVSVLASVFIVELAPERLRRVVIPVVRLLASVPSVIYGLIGILVIVPFVGNHIITAGPEGIRRECRPADGRRRRGRVADPDADDHADHDRVDLRGDDVRPSLLEGGGGRAWPEPAARRARSHAAGDPSRDRRRRGARERAARSVRRS